LTITSSPIPLSAEIVICGAGFAGISAAYHLAARQGIRDILLVDPLPPLSLTSDKSTECYRNWWPGPGDAMVALMNRSIDLMEELAQESGNVFHLSRRGYLYITGDYTKIPQMESAARAISALGAGPLRVHRGQAGDPPYSPLAPSGFTDQPHGADLLMDPVLHQHFPYLSERACAALHVRRAGWLSGQQLGSYLLEQARAAGARLLCDRITAVDLQADQVQAVHLESGGRIHTGCFVNAAGPLQNQVAALLGLELPVINELRLKVSFKDRLGILSRQAPLLIWNDPQLLAWTEEERQLLAEDPQSQPLLQLMPAGAHTRPEGGADFDIVLMLWEYNTSRCEPVWPVPLDPLYLDVLLRGLSTMLPGLQGYFEHPGRPYIDGGYYTQTRENRPLICPLPVQGAYLIGALSGFGLMSACAAGELLAQHITGAPLPHYAPAFLLERYQDPSYLASIAGLEDSGQL
jgi:glycine/D-amino acid oxidase-like deaminating enzyme